MTWEVVPTQIARGADVSVAWRRKGNADGFALMLSVSAALSARIGLVPRPDGRLRVLAERDRMAGKIRIHVPEEQRTKHSRAAVFKNGATTITIGLEDLALTTPQKAERAQHDWDGRYLVVKLPAWACPPVKVDVPPAAAKPTPLPTKRAAA
jgi:hypothetical protein